MVSYSPPRGPSWAILKIFLMARGSLAEGARWAFCRPAGRGTVENMPSAADLLIAEIHDAPLKVVLAVSGGGATAITGVLDVPGASRTVLEAVVPYAAKALSAWLGGPPDQACSAETARRMAMAAFRRACDLCEDESPVAGVACTASLATDRPKKGAHRAHVALQSEAVTSRWSIQLTKGARSRVGEEAVVAGLVLDMLAEASGVEERMPLDLLPGEEVDRSRLVAPQPWQDLLLGRRDAVRHGGPAADGEIAPKAVFPGAFNPLHAGHRGMAAVAEEMLGVTVEFELSILNVDKPPMDYLEIDRRVGQFAPEQAVWLTRLPTFEAKSRRFPQATFVVGTDTLRRIAQPRYYGDSEAACRQTLEGIASRGCRFLVFPRAEAGRTVTLADLGLPEPLVSICDAVPPERFMKDISSTEIRQAGKW